MRFELLKSFFYSKYLGPSSALLVTMRYNRSAELFSSYLKVWLTLFKGIGCIILESSLNSSVLAVLMRKASINYVNQQSGLFGLIIPYNSSLSSLIHLTCFCTDLPALN